MRRATIISLFSFITMICHGQIAYYDALTLSKEARKQPDAINIKLVAGVIINYLPKELIDTTQSLKMIDLIKKSNPFFNGYFEFDSSQRTAQGINDKFKRITSLPASLGSLNVTNIADGLARFLIERGKQELNVAFFNRLRNFLDSSQECQVLFPQSVGVLKTIEPYQYAEFIQSLRDAFHKDLSNLAVGLNELIELPKYQILLKNLPEIRLAVRSARIVQELSQSDGGILPDSIITQLASLDEWGEIDVNLGNSWKLLNIISQSVRDSASLTNRDSDNVTRRWITLSDMHTLIKDADALKIFLGLLYQKADGIYFNFKNESITVRQFMDSNVTNILAISSLIENFVTLANDVDLTIKDFKNKQKNNLLTNDDYYTYISKAVNITEYGFKAANTIYKFKAANRNKDDLLDCRYIIIARSGNELYKSIYSKNYNSAILNAYNILDQIFNHKDSLAIESSISRKLDTQSTTRLKDSVKSIETPPAKTIEAILKYGNFMAAIVKAESGAEVQSALEAAALPAGSYSVKQKSVFNLSVNGYIGYTWDFLHFPFKEPYANGIYAPIGISATLGSKRPHGFSFTLFSSIIDVGSLATYRLENGNDEELKQEVRLESIFSPSAQLFVEYGGWPLAVGGGWRLTPKLFYSNDETFTTVAPKNVFNFSILVDIPFFTIINKSFTKHP